MIDSRITKQAPYGQRIALRCKHHPHLRWDTKNIAPIGARTIFYDLLRESDEPECSCPRADLEPVPIDGPEVPE